MMSKLLKKTTNKKFLIVASCIMAVLLVAALVFSCVLMLNYGATTDDRATVTVTVDDYYFNTNLDKVKEVCDDAFGGAKVEYVYEGVMSGDSELVYVFDKTTDVSKLETALKTAVETQMQEGGKLADATRISVTSNLESNEPKIPLAYGYRAVGAIALFAVLAFLYVALRFRLNMGVAALVSVLLGAILSTSLVLVTRLPITGATFYAIAASVLVTAIFAVFTLSRLRAALKEENNADKSEEELIVSSVAAKEIVILASTLGAALIIVGAIATAVVRWFALTSLVCLIAATFIGLFFLPALYLPMLKAQRRKAAESSKSGYVGAKKGFLKKNKEETVTEEKTEESAE